MVFGAYDSYRNEKVSELKFVEKNKCKKNIGTCEQSGAILDCNESVSQRLTCLIKRER